MTAPPLSSPAPKAGRRLLDPMDRVSELLFGLIMVLTFTGTLSVADAGRESVREMLVAAMQVHLTFETVRQNEVVKRLAGWGAILAIPTMVFSWYGMNFRHMPELDWKYSYPAVVGGVALGSLLLYWRLKKSGWL